MQVPWPTAFFAHAASPSRTGPRTAARLALYGVNARYTGCPTCKSATGPARLDPMPSPRSSRTTLSVRVNAELAARVRAFVRDNAGKPLYLTLAGFVEQAVEAHIQATARALEAAEHAAQAAGGKPPPVTRHNPEIRMHRPQRTRYSCASAHPAATHTAAKP